MRVPKIEGPPDAKDGWASSARPGGLGQRSSCAHNINAAIEETVAEQPDADREPGQRLK